jgi:hypothetical protein
VLRAWLDAGRPLQEDTAAWTAYLDRLPDSTRLWLARVRYCLGRLAWPSG